MLLKTLANPRDKADLLQRLSRLRTDSARRWGRMSAHEMVCHLTDAFLMGTEGRPVSALTGWHYRTIVKWAALYVPLPWPPGVPTRPEIDQRIGGTKPDEFQRDVATLEAIVHRLTAEDDFFRGRAHPLFGVMADAGWMRWGYLHMNHHLRQFRL